MKKTILYKGKRKLGRDTNSNEMGKEETTQNEFTRRKGVEESNSSRGEDLGSCREKVRIHSKLVSGGWEIRV